MFMFCKKYLKYRNIQKYCIFVVNYKRADYFIYSKTKVNYNPKVSNVDLAFRPIGSLESFFFLFKLDNGRLLVGLSMQPCIWHYFIV